MPASSELTISQAEESDWPLIWPIWHEIVAAGDTYAYDPDTTYEAAKAMWLAPPPSETWIAGKNGAVLGMFHIEPNHPGPGKHIANGSYMVAATARGQGVGRALVEHSLIRAKEAGYRGMQFNAVAATNLNAIALYEHLGFAVVGAIPAGFLHPTDGFVDKLIMYRDL